MCVAVKVVCQFELTATEVNPHRHNILGCPHISFHSLKLQIFDYNKRRNNKPRINSISGFEYDCECIDQQQMNPLCSNNHQPILIEQCDLTLPSIGFPIGATTTHRICYRFYHV